MQNKIFKNSQGWYWPSADGNGNPEGPGSCWYGLSVGAPDLPKLVSQHVPEKKVVVQAGGNCGLYVKQYAEIFDIVYTFEPDPVNFFCLNLNVTNENVIKFQACLGNQHQTVSVGRTMPDVGSTHVTGTGNIPTMLIDDLNLTRCDLINLDVEGYELNVLGGAINTIQRCRPVIALEDYQLWSARYNSSLTIVEEFLATLGYKWVDDILSSVSLDKIYKFQP